MKIKIFHESIHNIESSINSWLKLNKSVNIIKLDTCYDSGYVLVTIVYDTAR